MIAKRSYVHTIEFESSFNFQVYLIETARDSQRDDRFGPLTLEKCIATQIKKKKSNRNFIIFFRV